MNNKERQFMIAKIEDLLINQVLGSSKHKAVDVIQQLEEQIDEREAFGDLVDDDFIITIIYKININYGLLRNFTGEYKRKLIEEAEPFLLGMNGEGD